MSHLIQCRKLLILTLRARPCTQWQHGFECKQCRLQYMIITPVDFRNYPAMFVIIIELQYHLACNLILILYVGGIWFRLCSIVCLDFVINSETKTCYLSCCNVFVSVANFHLINY